MLSIRNGVLLTVAAAIFGLGLATSAIAQQGPPPAGAPAGAKGSDALSDPFAAMAKAQAAAAAKIKEAEAMPTPRTAGGHPDLSGYWAPPVDILGLITAGGKAKFNASGSTTEALVGSESQEHQGNISGVAARKANAALRPAYKPEFQAKADQHFDRAAYLDPAYRCLPGGVPRMGAPTEIAQTANAVYLMYSNLISVPNPYRIIPTDGRAHDPDADPMADGDAVGHWEGDTLVIDVVNLDPDTWLDADGSFHDGNLHVVERITRKGNALEYQYVADDPTMFTKPFSPKPVTLLLGMPGEHAPLDYPCVEMDQSHLTTTERH
jgi:hypothetical protein